ncbi:hypothetical protein QJS04_geneDACA016180 [Acorus gramineus]|uniref:Uncharacterized protein n=1 Tax=Acorus gramineus TaxID=55184 RepID=A0AAV9AJZ6_ACOGR|nr:hypothetical protein QJS04_geneDACA016180 [Acorus gramineus]
MPKEKSQKRPMAPSIAPYPSEPPESQQDIQRWDDARCPVCMDHPHNAVLLLCSSHSRGCHPFICNTNHRLSNCLHRSRKKTNTSLGLLRCPFCRGRIRGWKLFEPARRFMDAKARTCSLETCDFTGSYSDLRRHARSVHPQSRPSDVDPDRNRDWRRIESEQVLGDVLSVVEADVTEELLLEMNEDEWNDALAVLGELFGLRVAAAAVELVIHLDAEVNALIGEDLQKLLSPPYLSVSRSVLNQIIRHY